MYLITFLCDDRKIRTFRLTAPVARAIAAGLTAAGRHYTLTEVPS